MSAKPQLMRIAPQANIQVWVFWLSALFTVIFGIATVLLGIQHILNQNQTLRQAKTSARLTAIQLARIIDEKLQKLTPITARIAADLSSGALKLEDAPPRLKQTLEENPDLFGVSIAYRPYAWKPGVRLFSFHAGRVSNGIELYHLEDHFDYSTYPWFQDGIAAGAPVWGEPYLGAISKKLLVVYTVPFYKKGDPSRTPIGLAKINMSLDQIQAIASNLGLGETGYAFLLSRKGVYLSDPVADYMHEQRTIFDVARQQGDEGRKRLGEKAVAGQRGEEEGVSGVTGQSTWMFSEPIPVSGWSIGTVFMKNEMLLDAQMLRRSLFRIECCLVMFLVWLSVLCFRVHEAGDWNLWAASITVSVILVAGISAMWWMTLYYPDRNGEVGVHIYGAANLQKFLTNDTKALGNVDPPQQVRTGIFIRTMRLGTANDVLLTGSMWQRYDSTLPGFTPGFTIPNAESLDIKETYHTKSGSLDVVGWDFKATLREPFEGSLKYPFERAMVRVRIAPRGFYKNIVLTPDLESYQLLVPTSLPGLDKSLVLPGWHPISSYFNYSPVDAGTSFGLEATLEQAKGQELGFTMIAQRNFLDPFVSSVLPIIVVAALLFGMLVVVSKQSDKIAATGVKGGDVLRTGVTLLFPVLVAQVNMRTKIGSSNIIYIEYFYFVLYTAILGVSANALWFTLKGHGFSNYRDNLIPKLIFWPALLGAFFGVSLFFLY